jgi:hypothetical protein
MVRPPLHGRRRWSGGKEINTGVAALFHCGREQFWKLMEEIGLVDGQAGPGLFI